MDGERLNPYFLKTFSDLFDVFRVLIPSKAGLDRDRKLGGADDLPRHLHHLVHILEDSRSSPLTDHIAHRTSEIDVDDIRL